jgi:uncharacterized protein YvpB/uncharacterized protein YoxC
MFVMALAFMVLGVWVWQETKRVQELEAGLASLSHEAQTAESQALALQDTTAALEARLVTLESQDVSQQIARLEAALAASGDSQQVADLRASLSAVQADVNGFQLALDSLATRMNALEAKGVLPPEARLEVARQKQSHNLSCESSAASMVAQYHDVGLGEEAVLAALPLDPNPHLGFRGNVDGPTGGTQDYGVYAPPLLDVLNSNGLRARPVKGGLDGIKAAIARGNPVIAWVTYDCRPSTPEVTTIDGETVTLVPWQHVVVVTGYNEQGVWANDPWDGKVDYYPAADFRRALSYFGDMAIEVAGP